MSAAYVIDAIRTPIGKYGGSLAGVRPDDLLAHVIKALLQKHPEQVNMFVQILYLLLMIIILLRL